MNARCEVAKKNLAEKKSTQKLSWKVTNCVVMRVRKYAHRGEGLAQLAEDSASLKAMLCSLLAERDREKQRADDLHIQNLRLQLELARYKKWYYGPRADRLNSTSELAQVLLDFGQELEQRPIHPEDVPAASEPEYELRRVKRRKGRRSLANFENLPVTTQVYELSAEERTCPGCGVVRQEIGRASCRERV